MRNRIDTEKPALYETRLNHRRASKNKVIWDLLDAVCDPEIPVISLWDLAVLTNIEYNNNTVVVTLTPTYSGCPAMEVMREDIITTLLENNYPQVEIKIQLSPAWSSNALSPEGRNRLRESGITPPDMQCGRQSHLESIACPKCHGSKTRQISEFGSTACKALYQCQDCLEPFDYFKSI